MIKSSNGDTPFSLTYGTEAVIPAEIGMPTYRTVAVEVIHNDEELRLNLDLLEERRERAAIREAEAKLKMTKYYNARVRGVTFRPCDFVYRSNNASYAVDGKKLGPKWEGPYEVAEALGDGAYKLRSENGTVLPRTWNDHKTLRSNGRHPYRDTVRSRMMGETGPMGPVRGCDRLVSRAKVIENQVMAISVISVSSDSSEDSVGTPVRRVILFRTIPTTIPDTTSVITPPTTQTDTTVIPTETPIIAPTIPPSPDYTPTSPDYSPTSDTESDPSEDPLSGHIPPLPAVSPFLSSDDDTTDSDTPDTPPSPTHGTPFTEITFSTPRSPVIPRRRVMILAPGQPIPHDSSSEASSDFHSDASSDSSLRHSLSYHSSFDLPSTSARPSRKRRRSPMTSVPALLPVSGALSHVCADLIPSPKRVRDSGYLADVEVGPRETSLRDDVIAKDALKDRGIDARVVVKAVDRHKIEIGVRGPVEVRVEMITHPAMPEDILKPAQEGAVEVTYETLGDLVQRFHDHTQAIPVHHIQVIEGVQKEQGHRIVRVESSITTLTERVAELERDNRRLRGTVSVESQRVDRLQRGIDLTSPRNLIECYVVTLSKMTNTRSGASMTHEEVEELVARRVAEEMEAREAARNLETLNKNGDEHEVRMEEIGMKETEEMEMERMEETEEMEMKGMEKIRIMA
nr:reverse transcriptase domain-containing protein [Tanacetum cinerariifolium]